MGEVEAEHAARVVGRMWNGHGELWVIAVVVDVDVVIDINRSLFVRCQVVTRHSRIHLVSYVMKSPP